MSEFPGRSGERSVRIIDTPRRAPYRRLADGEGVRQTGSNLTRPDEWPLICEASNFAKVSRVSRAATLLYPVPPLRLGLFLDCSYRIRFNFSFGRANVAAKTARGRVRESGEEEREGGGEASLGRGRRMPTAICQYRKCLSIICCPAVAASYRSFGISLGFSAFVSLPLSI